MNNELMTQIEALDDREYLHEWGTAKAMGDGIPVTAIKSLAAELTLANKKLAILQASNDHYADLRRWICDVADCPCVECGHAENVMRGLPPNHIEPKVNGPDFARKTQEEIARLTEGDGSIYE